MDKCIALLAIVGILICASVLTSHALIFEGEDKDKHFVGGLLLGTAGVSVAELAVSIDKKNGIKSNRKLAYAWTYLMFVAAPCIAKEIADRDGGSSEWEDAVEGMIAGVVPYGVTILSRKLYIRYTDRQLIVAGKF